MDVSDAMALGNPQSKMFTYLLAESCMKMNGSVNKNGVQRGLSPFRAIYDEAKAKYEITRPDPEKGEKESAERWSKGHRHAAALRITGKAILKELWIASKADLALSTGGDFELTDEANPRDAYDPLAA